MATEEKNVADETKDVKEEEATKESKGEVAEKEGEKKTEAAGAAATPAATPKPTVHKVNYEKDVVYLYQFSRTPVIPSISPYCLKVETWLRLAGIQYENVDHKTKLRSKKGQLPFVELNGEEIADSTIIMQELSKRFDKDVDALLTNEQKNIAHAMIAMIENQLFWVVMAWRSKYPEQVIKGYKVNLQHALGTKVPSPILNFLFKFAVGRKILNPQGSKKVRAHGIGVHKPEEILKFGQDDLKVLSELLADKPFFFGDEPSSLDIVAFANLAQIYFLDKEVDYPLRETIQENHPNLVGLINRMKERCFSDWEDICKTLDLNAHLPKPPPEEKEADKKENKDEKEKKDKEIKDEVEKEKDEKKENENENEVENKLKEEKEKEAAK